MVSCIPTAATILLQLSLWLLVTPLLVATNENQGDVAVMPDGMPDPEKSQHIEDLVVESLQLQDDAAQFLAYIWTRSTHCPPPANKCVDDPQCKKDVEALLISGQEEPDDDSSKLVRALHKCLVNEEDGAGFDAAWEAQKERAEALRKKDPDERTKAEQAEIDAYDKKMKDVADAEKQQAEKDANKTAKDAESVDADDDQSAAKDVESVDTEDDQSAEEVHLSDDDSEDNIDDRDYDYDECEEHCREYPEECKDCRKVAELQRADNAGTIKLTKEQEEYLFKWSQTQFYRDFGYPEGHPKHIPEGQPGHGGKFGAGNEQSAGDDDDQSTEQLSDTVDEELTSQDENVDTIPDDGDYIDADGDDDYESKELSDVVDDDGSDMRYMRIEENLQAMLQDFRAKDEMQKSRLYDKLQAAYPATIDQKIEDFIMHEYAKLGGDDDAAEALIASISMLGTEATDVKPSPPPQRQPANAVEKESSAGHPNLPKSDVQWNEGDDLTTINMHKVAREQKRQKAESKLQRQLAKHAKTKAKREAKKKAQNDEQFLQMVWSRAKECPAPGRDCSEDARCRAEVEDMVRQEKEGPDPGASAMMKSLSDCLLAD